MKKLFEAKYAVWPVLSDDADSPIALDHPRRVIINTQCDQDWFND